MKLKSITLVVLVVLVLAASLSCTKNTTREQTTHTSVPTTAVESTTAVTTTIEPSNSAITHLYFDAIKEVYSEDSGLNGGISIISLDLSGVKNLSVEEKEDLRYLVSCEYSLNIPQRPQDASQKNTFAFCVDSAGLLTQSEDMTEHEKRMYFSSDELVDLGMIDAKNLNFEKGILFEITDETIADNAFTFQISKWRSGLGAIFYSDCTAKKTGDTWEYSLGGFAIS